MMIRWGPIKMLATILGLICLIAVVLQQQGYRFNFSRSMPQGIYLRDSQAVISHGDFVSVCLPDTVASEGVSRGYIPHGSCQNGSMPVVKKIIALPGDQVQVTRVTIIVNGQRYLAPSQSEDHSGQSIKKFVQHSRALLTNSFWLYGAHDPHQSWDSRYFGGVSAERIEAIYRPVWVVW